MHRITKNPALAACWLMSSLAAQTQVDLRNQTKNVDLQTAPFTKPLKSGAVLPATCTQAELFFETTAPPGANVFGCTAPNTWSLQGGSGGAINAVNGTAQRITASTVSGTVTLTLPSNLLFPGNVTFVAGTTGAPSFNVPSGVAPASPTAGDFWNLSGILQYSSGSGIRSILVDNSSLNASNIGSGTLAKARIIGTAVFTDQSNTFSTGTQDFGSATSLKIAHGAGYAPTVSASIGYDDTANLYKFGVSGTSKIMAMFSGTFSDNDCLKYQGSTNSIITAGVACGGGGGGITALTADATASGSGSVAITFATVNSNVGTCGDSTHVPQLMLNGKGLATACTPVAITGGGGGIAAVTGTARQITAATVSGTVTLTLPSNLLFPGNVTFVAGTTGAPSFNVPSGVAPTSPTAGDMWNLSGILQYSSSSGTRSILVDNSSLNASNVGSGTLAKARIIGTAVFTDQSNAFSTGTQDFGLATALKIAHSAGYAPTASASIGYDDTANVYRFGVNGASKIATMFSGAFSDNDCLKYQASTNSIITAGAACGSGGGSGTVTHTAGALTLNQLTFGNGSADIAVGDLTGDVTTSGGKATTLAASGVTAGSCGDATHSCSITVDAKGRTTTLLNNTISGGGGTPGGSTNDIQINNAGSFAGGRCTMDSSSNVVCAGSMTTGNGSGLPGAILLTPGTVASLGTCNAGAEGTHKAVTDSNAASYTSGIGAVVVGGGTTHVPVYCDGTSWRIG